MEHPGNPERQPRVSLVWSGRAALWLVLGGLALCANERLEARETARAIPRPLAAHPGNIFLRGESVTVNLPGAEGDWNAVDYEGKQVASGKVQEGAALLGKLPVGYYEISAAQGTNSHPVTAGVLEPLVAPTPDDSPICIDVAMAWFFPKERMAAPANLCTLAGINWVRDRLLWEELEPKKGQFPERTRYDDSMEAQVAAGLKILQVGHVSASWANPNTRRFPADLREIHDFYREIARRWRGRVLAFEPWNEADIKEFGGQTGNDMASLQKAVYLGLKEGNPDVTACENVFAIHRMATLTNFDANEAWPYFDTFNLHHYQPLNEYPKVYADFRAVSAGKPMWVTECSVHVRWAGDEQLKELNEADLRLQSERLTKTYTLALYQGAARVFYFMLPQYSEGRLQYGLLHSDLTPRPGYLALAAVGRLLAGAKPLGRVALPDKVGQAYFFSANIDGKPAKVAVTWARSEAHLALPQPPAACFDHLGRPVPVNGKVIEVGPAPHYVLLADGALPTLIPPPKAAPLRPGKPGQVVLQALVPPEETVVEKSAYKMAAAGEKTFPIYLYNFATNSLSGQLRVDVPDQWKAEMPTKLQLAPLERKGIELKLTPPTASAWTEGTIKIHGNFGEANQAVLSFQVVPD